jgi:hypothetical protein
MLTREEMIRRLLALDKPKPAPISAAEHNRRARALQAQDEMERRAREMPLERMQAILDQGQEAYLERLREREAVPDPIEAVARSNWGLR